MTSSDMRSDLPDDECNRTYHALLTNIRQHRKDQFHELLAIIPAKDTDRVLKHCENEGETLLHTAVKLHSDSDIVISLIDTCPDLLTASRDTSDLYRGQTALHMAITDRNMELTMCLLEKAKAAGARVLTDILQKRATGRRFENTVMLGEHPFAVAALTFNIEIMCKLIEFGAELGQCNSQGDNVIHCLVKYAHLYPEKLENVISMFDHIVKVTNSCVHGVRNPADIDSIQDKEDRKFDFQIWLTKNNDLFNPLQMAATLGQQEIFKFIMEMRGVYCYVNSEDGLFDVELFDVTDIDTIQPRRKKTQKVESYDDAKEYKPGIVEPYQALQAFVEDIEDVAKVPTLELIFSSEPKTVFKFIQMTPLRFVINKKWKFYRLFYAIWGVLHVLYMVGMTVYAIRRSDVHVEPQSEPPKLTKKNVIGKSAFETFFLSLNLIVACVYLLQEIVRIIRGHMPWSFSHLMNCYHNGPFRLAMVIFSLTVLADCIWFIVSANDCKDYLLVVSMIFGWWFIVFFLRGFKQFSFFTVMIQKIIVGDMFRFSIIISMELIAFSTGLFIAFRGSPITENSVLHYGELTVYMFKMMFGLTSLDVLFEAREPWFAVCLYMAFVILTYVLMVNSLIAMMSNTCSVVSQNREIQYRVQQLSIVLFFESIIPKSWKCMVGNPRPCTWYDPTTQRFTMRKRYFMEVKSLHEISKSRSRHRPNPETMLETIFHTITQIQLPKFLTDINSPVELVRNALSESAPTAEDVNNTNSRVTLVRNALNEGAPPTERPENIDSVHTNTRPISHEIPVGERPVTISIVNAANRSDIPRLFERRVSPEEHVPEDMGRSPIHYDNNMVDREETVPNKKKKKKKSKKHHVDMEDDDTYA